MNHFAHARLLVSLSCGLCFPAATWAADLDVAEPGPRLLADPQAAALEQALLNAARQKAQAGEEAAPPPEPVNSTSLNIAGALLVVAALTALRLAPWLNRRFGSWMPKPAAHKDLAPSLLEEPSVVAFFEALKAGPAAHPACPAAAANAPQEFHDSTARRLADLRKLLTEIGQAADEAARQTKLLEAFRQAGKLREGAGLPELSPMWQVALALEELLKQLLRKGSGTTPSALLTAAGALDLLADLSGRNVRPDLATEPPVRLLAVDDDPICRKAVSFALAKAFREPDLAPDGANALALAVQQSYDAIFLDLQMPGMDGFELCSRIHQTEPNRTTPVVFVTRQDDLESRAQATLLGAQDFIAKPFLVFEITLKALTMVLRSRLASGGVGAGSSKRGVSASPQPSSVPSSPEVAALREPSPPAQKELAHAFFTHVPPQIDQLRKQLAAAANAGPGDLNELLGDFYLDAHTLCSDARHAELRGALRLTSALEALARKLFDCPKLCTASTLDSAAGALDVLEGLCRTRTDLDPARSPARLMVVDDDPVACRAIALSLQLVFGRPEIAGSGEAALALARNSRYDLFFLDVQMPGLDGFGTCSQLHATGLNCLTPVVFVTSHNDTASRAQAALSGGCGFIPKPVLASQIALVALTYVLQCRLGAQIPALEAPPANGFGEIIDPRLPTCKSREG